MAAMTVHLDIVSAESKIFSGRVASLQVTGSEGELGIMHGHAPLLSYIKPFRWYSGSATFYCFRIG